MMAFGRRHRLSVIGWLALALIGACSKSEPELPHLAQVPAFALLDQHGRNVAREDFSERVWIVNFMFTSCPTICPKLTARMANLQQQLSGSRGWHLVSISVDPRNDTPERLRSYALEHQVDLNTWSFLTGPLEDIQQVVVQGFKQAMEHQAPGENTQADILHGSHFVLVDRAGTIRGYYASDDAGTRQLIRDTRALLDRR